MIDRDELEVRLATTLSPMLLTIATFSLTVMGLQSTPNMTIVDEVFGLLGAFCLLAAAIVADSALDKQNLNVFDRLKFLGGGYLFFCIVVGAMSTAIPVLYTAKNAVQGGMFWDKSFLFFLAYGVSVIFKLMSKNDRQAWTVSMFIFYIASVYVLCK